MVALHSPLPFKCPLVGAAPRLSFRMLQLASSLLDKSPDFMVACMMADCGVQSFRGGVFGCGFGARLSGLGSASVLNGIKTPGLPGVANGMFEPMSDAEDT